ncbi:MarR family winged helix-turn-helix transcriptional regulator [Tepidimonas charontis]|uniref:Putative HTH-type transcriptional regulator n=1 Tax=Tepidimonas charontis TaxID=2267262 RepID=A0A554XGM2_9BURK|nr:MarR family transcriptional regulator [Tepidimonas charontis]TSE34976.1 putative HTH-type transcriptional regulator [Tepidimonas charontis]
MNTDCLSCPADNTNPVATDNGPDTRFLESLIGYNARRAALALIGHVLPRLEPLGLRVVDFSVLTLIAHNPGITSRQLCAALDILPPNLVGVVRALEQRGWIERRDHPSDRRAQALHVTAAGAAVQAQAQALVSAAEHPDVTHLSEDERTQLIRLLRKVYLGNRA